MALPVRPSSVASRRPRPRAAASTALVLAAVATLSACGEPAPVEIRDVRTRSAHAGPIVVGVAAIERLGLANPFAKALPVGWTEAEAPADAPGRLLTARVAGRDDTPVTLSTASGTLEANVNRWRAQVGLAPLEAAAVAALPTRPFFGGAGVFVDLRGPFAGMGGHGALADARLLGLLLPSGDALVVLKVVGPAGAVDAEVERFLAFAAALRSDALAAARDPAVPAPPREGAR